MIDHMGYSRILASSDELSQIIIFVIILAIGLIGNITKARAQKRTGHTGQNRPDRKPTGQRHPQSARPRPRPRLDEKQRTPKYYAPGGFAEVLQDEALERTLKSRSKLATKKQEWLQQHPEDEEQSIQPIESTKVMAHDLESMGYLDTLDEADHETGTKVMIDMTSNLTSLSLYDPEDLAKAVLYHEILSKPVALRDCCY